MQLNFITCPLHPGCNGCNYMTIHDHYMPNKMLMKAADVSGPPPCSALSVSGPVRRTPSPGCPMAPPRCALNKKHPCHPIPVCCSISSKFLPRAAGGRIQKAVSYVCIFQVYVQFPCLSYVRYIAGIYQIWDHDIYQTYTRHIPDI